ncbi:hypothetical protein GGQ54_001524 [Naumannella cuiyingiana]|uniref:Aminoglycoside phosphotransferase domain-containing protein n=1 Tax=Naumannella cuiyingiana TaxID=1347891 RepID=A0A7Z0D8L3_9ACTN|nr:phosphotransferase [Naumannella cuiyingiana]NYI70964.1 hypothetical protein [Naumannella cuiyingiana]
MDTDARGGDQPDDWRVRALAELGLGTPAAGTLGAAEPTVASPSWWGADSRRFRVVDGDRRIYVKVWEPHAAHYTDTASSTAAALAAGRAGIGPEVVAADPGGPSLAMTDIGETTATLDRFGDTDSRLELARLRAAVADIGTLPRQRQPLDEPSELARLASDIGAWLPADLSWLLRRLEPVAERVRAEGWDEVAAHGDGNLSNVMVTADGTLALVDWDSAAMMDPLADLGVLLIEVCPDRRSAAELFEAARGRFDVAEFDRANAYGAAELLRWALIGSIADAVQPGTQEYSKFADWQFLRARWALSEPAFDVQLGGRR